MVRTRLWCQVVEVVVVGEGEDKWHRGYVVGVALREVKEGKRDDEGEEDEC